MASIVTGTIIVRPICAKLVRDTESIGKMDPYCVVKVGNQSQKTKVASGAGKFPNWEDQLVFKKTVEDVISVAVWDYDSGSADDLVGEGTLSMERVLSTSNWEDWVEISHHGTKAGDVRLSVTFTRDVGMQGPAQGLIPGPAFVGHGPQYGPPPGYPPQGLQYPPQGFQYPPPGYGPVPGYPPNVPQGSRPVQVPPGQYPPHQAYPGQYPPPQPGFFPVQYPAVNPGYPPSQSNYTPNYNPNNDFPFVTPGFPPNNNPPQPIFPSNNNNNFSPTQNEHAYKNIPPTSYNPNTSYSPHPGYPPVSQINAPNTFAPPAKSPYVPHPGYPPV